MRDTSTDGYSDTPTEPIGSYPTDLREKPQVIVDTLLDKVIGVATGLGLTFDDVRHALMHAWARTFEESAKRAERPRGYVVLKQGTPQEPKTRQDKSEWPPPWYGAGSLEDHRIPSRQANLGPMDPADVVDPYGANDYDYPVTEPIGCPSGDPYGHPYWPPGVPPDVALRYLEAHEAKDEPDGTKPRPVEDPESQVRADLDRQ